MQNNPVQKSAEFPKKDVDYYEFADGEYWPVESLRQKYECSSFHIYDRAKKHNIAKKKIADVTLFKDMPDLFVKKLPGKRDTNGNLSAEHIKQYRTVQFAELCRDIRAMQEKFDRMQEKFDRMQMTLDAILDHVTLPKER